MQFFHIPNNRGLKVVMPEQIIRVEGISNYSKIFFTNMPPLVVAKVLHWFQDGLPAQMFTRVHRSHLVNRMYVKEMNGSKNKFLLLRNGETVAVSRRKQRCLTDAMLHFKN